MFCPSCGKQIADTAKFCTSCGRPLPVVPQAVFVSPMQPQNPMMNPVLPQMGAVPQKKPSSPLKIVLVIVAVLVLVPILIGFVVGFAQSFETTDQKVARLMREAAGLQPVKKPFFGEDSTDTKMRDFFRNLIQLNKEYQASVDKLDISETSSLTSAESFADPTLAAEGLRQLHAAYDLDAQQEQRLQQVMDNFRHQFDDVSSWERDIILKGFDEGVSKGMPERQRATSTEKAWIEAMDDVYSYAGLHHVDFELRAGHLVVTDHSELLEFNAKVDNLNARRQEFMRAKDEFNRYQGQTWQKIGMSRQDSGLK
jgi:zinc-ribbon domain